MIVECCVTAIAAAIVGVFFVRAKDIQPPEPVSTVAHLSERKRAIHECLRDLQFDFRIGKLSNDDYQAGKLSLQQELASVLVGLRDAQRSPKAACASCGEEFSTPMKFCGSCGRAMV